jgi:hypothetical protein
MGKVKDITHTRQRQIVEKVDVGIYKRLPEDTCYFCGAEDLELDRSDFYDLAFPEVWIDVQCGNCDKQWREIYELRELWIRSD